MTRPIAVALFLAIVTCVTSQPASAFLMNYGDFPGTDVIYLGVTEQNAGPSALFGAPAVQGNTLDFDPLNFKAGPVSNGSQQVTGQLSTTIMSNSAAFPLSRIVIDEAGDFTLTGLGPATAEVTVAMTAQFSVTEVNGVPVGMPLSGMGTMTFVPASVPNGEWSLPAFAGTGVLWNGHLDIDLDAFLAANSVAGHVTKVEVIMENDLTATSANGGSAFIAKKEFQGLSISVPEPSSLGLLMAALVSLNGLRRRERSRAKARHGW